MEIEPIEMVKELATMFPKNNNMENLGDRRIKDIYMSENGNLKDIVISYDEVVTYYDNLRIASLNKYIKTWRT